VDVILNHFRHQSRYCPPHTGDQVHDLFTASLAIERTLDGLDLTRTRRTVQGAFAFHE
jgi:hypothetical protein